MLRRDRIYAYFLMATKRLSERQMMMVLAVIVGAMAGVGTYLFEVLLHTIKSCLVSWFPVDEAHFSSSSIPLSESFWRRCLSSI